MAPDPADWPPDDGPSGHVRRFARAVVACAEFIAPLVPDPWRRPVLSWTRRLLSFVAFAGRLIP